MHAKKRFASPQSQVVCDFFAAQYIKNITGSQIGRESKAEIHDVMYVYIYIIYTSFIIKILWAKSC